MKRMSKGPLIAAGLLIYLVFLLAYIPAKRVLAWAPLPSKVQLNDVSGTLWRGHIQRVIVNGIAIDTLDWSLSVLPLLWGEASIELEGGQLRQRDTAAVKGKLSLGLGYFAAENLSIFLPANQAIGQMPLPIPINADGRFKVTLQKMSFAGKCESLTGQGQWLGAGILMPGERVDLGNFDAALSCQGDDVQITVQEPNSFGLNAQVLVSPNGKYRVNGRFKPSDSLPEELRQTAQFFGQADASGYYQIAF